jgi:bifunctional non-homologous end joining protein LigD
LAELTEELSEIIGDKSGETAQPLWIDPMLATLTEERFSRKDWIFEPKFDGERCLAFKQGREIRLYSRNRKAINSNYPELVEALEVQEHDFIVDGEVVAFEGGITSFAKLQGRIQTRNSEDALRSGIKVYYYIFDLLHLNGHDTRKLGLLDRKKLLRRAIAFKDPLRFTAHRDTEGESYYREACEKGWEGLIAKRADSEYVGKRSRDWLKFKCVAGQEFVIGGYTQPRGERFGFGALLVGYYRAGKLVYAGKVGTGFNDETLRSLTGLLSKLEQERSPFEEEIREKGVRWVAPKLVAQVGFSQWTPNGKLRHPRFEGLRRDKEARGVVREG